MKIQSALWTQISYFANSTKKERHEKGDMSWKSPPSCMFKPDSKLGPSTVGMAVPPPILLFVQYLWKSSSGQAHALRQLLYLFALFPPPLTLWMSNTSGAPAPCRARVISPWHPLRCPWGHGWLTWRLVVAMASRGSCLSYIRLLLWL